jgi:hypothetical protein
MLNRARALVGTVGAGILVTALAAPAMAVSWGTITAYNDSGAEVARAYGSFYNEGAQYAKMEAEYKDSRAGGNAVFVEVDYYFWYQACSQCQAQYNYAGSSQTDRTSTGTWVFETRHHSLDSRSNSARGAIQVCEDQAWSPDDCSVPRALPTFSY